MRQATIDSMDEEKTRPPKTVAVIGSGLAGLTTAYLLQRSAKYQVKIFEMVSQLASTPSDPFASLLCSDFVPALTFPALIA